MPNSITSSVKVYAARYGENVRTVYLQIKKGYGVGPYFEEIDGKLQIREERENEYRKLKEESTNSTSADGKKE